jgi:hypothetical protein
MSLCIHINVYIHLEILYGLGFDDYMITKPTCDLSGKVLISLR